MDFPWPPWDNLLLLTKEDTVKDIQEKVSRRRGREKERKAQSLGFRVQGLECSIYPNLKPLALNPKL